MALLARSPSQYLVNLVAALGGRWDGHVAMCRCPAHQDRTPSLSLRQGDRDILVTCFAGCDAEDVLRELGRIPLSGGHPVPRPQAARQGGTANVERIWSEAMPVAGSLAERYLERRQLLPPSNDLRFHPRCAHGPKPHTKFKPALLVGVRERNRLIAIQRIFLDRETAYYTEKVTLGLLASGAWQGGGLAATIGWAEGFESAAAYSRLKGIPCWSPLGSRRFDLASIPDSVTTLVLAGDNDGPGRLAVTKAIKRYVSNKRIVLVDFPPEGFNDWAEVLEAKERGEGVAG
ncbi:DUF7146 domain-containing protein [Sphingomonas xinjiangensis]|uniref:DUF7146 domain-containing protein n=1 Tax=Sphingomonas xinjiangensis TaxID=643568 RepID=A0A840YRJ6_9SPHN|nr:toprim domain-containing protein [Sphingomonas xinjiangensis]MBB5712371.1 hypothetical protein [Sphingomonas xinjiangensis]